MKNNLYLAMASWLVKEQKQRIFIFTPIDKEIRVLRMEAKSYNISIINIPAPTEDEDKKNIL